MKNISNFCCSAKLYIPSTLNIDLILWHTQLIVYAAVRKDAVEEVTMIQN